MSHETAARLQREATERQFRMQDKHERGQAAVAEQLWEVDQALSNRVRIFAVGVLAVSWGLLLDPRGFDPRLVLLACTLSLISLVFDFAYFICRRAALEKAYRRGIHALGGAGLGVILTRLASLLRAIFFFGATATLIFAAVRALLPTVFPSLDAAVR